MSSRLITLGVGTPADIASLTLAGLSANPLSPGNAHVITMGVGTPSDVAHLMLFGLTVNPGAPPPGGGSGVMRRIGYGGGLISV